MAATAKLTITLRKSDLAAVRELVAAGAAASVSGFVQHAVRMSLDDVKVWGEMLAEGLEATGGPMTNAERAWADEALGISDPAS